MFTHCQPPSLSRSCFFQEWMNWFLQSLASCLYIAAIPTSPLRPSPFKIQYFQPLHHFLELFILPIFPHFPLSSISLLQTKGNSIHTCTKSLFHLKRRKKNINQTKPSYLGMALFLLILSSLFLHFLELLSVFLVFNFSLLIQPSTPCVVVSGPSEKHPALLLNFIISLVQVIIY